jgi:hypothetical protein
MVKFYKVSLSLTGLMCLASGVYTIWRFDQWNDGVLQVILGTILLVGYILLDVLSNMAIVTKVEVIKPDGVNVQIVNKNCIDGNGTASDKDK